MSLPCSPQKSVQCTNYNYKTVVFLWENKVHTLATRAEPVQMFCWWHAGVGIKVTLIRTPISFKRSWIYIAIYKLKLKTCGMYNFSLWSHILQQWCPVGLAHSAFSHVVRLHHAPSWNQVPSMLVCGLKQLGCHAGHHVGHQEVDVIQKGKQYENKEIKSTWKLKDSCLFSFSVSDVVPFIKITFCCYSKWFPATNCKLWFHRCRLISSYFKYIDTSSVSSA